MIQQLLSSIALILACVLLHPGENAVQAQFIHSELRSVATPIVQVGTTKDVRVTGERLEEAHQWWCSHAGVSATIKLKDSVPVSGEFSLSVAGDTPPGRYDVRVIGLHGISSPRSIFVTLSPVQWVDAPSVKQTQPTPMTIGTIAQSRLQAEQIHCYRLVLDTPKTLRIRTFAQSIDTRAILAVRLMGSSGQTLARARGADEVDPMVELQEIPSGEYLLAVHDVLYRGGDEWTYGVLVEEAAATSINKNSIESMSIASFGLRGIPQTDKPSEPQTPSSAPMSISLPYDGYWWFDEDHVSRFEFDAKEGDRYWIECVSHQQGEPTDPRLLIERVNTDAAGVTTPEELWADDDSREINDGVVSLQSRDPAGMFVAAKAGRYQLSLRDQDIGTSLKAKQFYRLRIQPPKPMFSLFAYQSIVHIDNSQARPRGSNLYRGGTDQIRVIVDRRESWQGAVQVSLVDPPAGISASAITIAPQETKGSLSIQVADDAPAFTGRLQVVGRAADLPDAIPAMAGAHSHSRGFGREFVRTRIADALVVSVTDGRVAPVTIQLGPTPDPITETVGKPIKLPVKLIRREGSSEPCILRVRNLPGGVTGGDVTIPGDKSEGEFVFNSTPQLAQGTYSLFLTVETKVKIKIGDKEEALTVFLPSTTRDVQWTAPPK